MTSYDQCPRCNGPKPAGVAGPGISMSRRDNRTPICAGCGTEEALIDFGILRSPDAMATDNAFRNRLAWGAN